MAISQVIEPREDLTQPIMVDTLETKRAIVHEAVTGYNKFVLRERESHGKRTKVRMAFEVWSRKNIKGLGFVRLRHKHVVFSLPNADQAELVIDTIRRVCAQFDGKLLVPPSE